MTDRCNCCGTRLGAADPLVAAADVLVLRALERVCNHVLRSDRSRYAALNGRPRHEAYRLWQPDRTVVDQALGGAWVHVPSLVDDHAPFDVDPDEVAAALDRYTRDLLATGARHDVAELRYRLTAFLGVPA